MSRPISSANSIPDHQRELLELHSRLLLDDPVATEEIFAIATPELERHLRMRFPSIAIGVDPDIYLSAVFDALTEYFKNPSKYDPDKSGLMTYLRMAARWDMQNLLAKESRHAKGRTPLERETVHDRQTQPTKPCSHSSTSTNVSQRITLSEPSSRSPTMYSPGCPTTLTVCTPGWAEPGFYLRDC